MQINEALQEYIGENFFNGLADDELDDDTNLLAGGLIDSLGVFQLITYIEELMGIDVPVEEVTIENFGSIRAITRYLQSKCPHSIS